VIPRNNPSGTQSYYSLTPNDELGRAFPAKWAAHFRVQRVLLLISCKKEDASQTPEELLSKLFLSFAPYLLTAFLRTTAISQVLLLPYEDGQKVWGK